MPRPPLPRTLIIGAGVAGLGAAVAARELGLEFEVIESAEQPGGLVQTDDVDGFRFDRTAHVLHFRSHRLRQRFRELGVPLRATSRNAVVVVNRQVIPYPLQYNLWALSDADLAASLLGELARTSGSAEANGGSFADLLEARWGKGLVSIFLRPYNEKLWGRRLEQLPADCAGDYLPKVDLALAHSGATGPTAYGGYNGRFLYPASGRLDEIAACLANPIREQLACAEAVVSIDLDAHEATTSRGRTLAYEKLVGTAPLPTLLDAAGCLNGAGDLFDATSVANVRIAVRGRMRTPAHWLYAADSDVPFHRIAFPRNLSASTCPAGHASLSVEYTVPREGPRATTDEIARAAVAYVHELGLVDLEEVVGVWEAVISPAYVVHRAPTRSELSDLRSLLTDHDVHVAGRFGLWDYLSIEQAFASGTHAIEAQTAA